MEAKGQVDGRISRQNGATNHIAIHIFVAEKGDYYDILGDAPQFPGRPEPPAPVTPT